MERLFSSTQRNIDFIGDLLLKIIKKDGLILEIGNYLWGIRNLEEVTDEAKKNGFFQEKIICMPANNFSIIYRKISY